MTGHPRLSSVAAARSHGTGQPREQSLRITSNVRDFFRYGRQLVAVASYPVRAEPLVEFISMRGESSHDSLEVGDRNARKHLGHQVVKGELRTFGPEGGLFQGSEAGFNRGWHYDYLSQRGRQRTCKPFTGRAGDALKKSRSAAKIPAFYSVRRVSEGVGELAGGLVDIKRLNKSRVVKDHKPTTQVFSSLCPTSFESEIILFGRLSFKKADTIKAGKRSGRHYSFPPESAVVNSIGTSAKRNPTAMQCDVAKMGLWAGTSSRDQLELFGVAA